jgi:transposase
MISIASDIKVLVCLSPIDMRKGVNSLTLLVLDTLKQDPQSKQMFLFHNKGRDTIKAILWDKNGFILLYKKLEQGKFTFPQDIHNNYIEIDSDLLKWLMQGFDFYRLKHHPELKFSQYF